MAPQQESLIHIELAILFVLFHTIKPHLHICTNPTTYALSIQQIKNMDNEQAIIYLKGWMRYFSTTAAQAQQSRPRGVERLF